VPAEKISPEWAKNTEEETVDEVGQTMGEEDMEIAVDTSGPVVIAEEDVQLKRQSNRIKEQGTGYLKVADKAEALKSKKNLEGTSIHLKNSFAVLNNNELIVRSQKMGVNTNNLDLEHFDIMRDLEKARSNLTDRSEDLAKGKQIVEKEPLPFEELKLITWHSDESDEEGFKLVSSKKKYRKKKNVRTNKKNMMLPPNLLMGWSYLMRMYLRLALDTT